MPSPVTCQNCGESFPLPAGNAKAKLRCPVCGVYVQLTEAERAAREAAPVPVIPAAPTRPVATEPDSPPAAIPIAEASLAPLVQGTEDDDGLPYSVPADLEEERRKLEASRPKKRKPLPPVEHAWENGWPLAQRVAVFAAMQVINLASTLLIVSDPLGIFVNVLWMAGFQAFLLGSYPSLRLTRSAKGKITVRIAWRVAFYPLPSREVPWREHDWVDMGKLHEPKFEDWFILLVLVAPVLLNLAGAVLRMASSGFPWFTLLTTPVLLLPGVLWWWFVIRPERIDVYLCKDHGHPSEKLYRTTDEDLARDVAEQVAAVTTLPFGSLTTHNVPEA